VKRRDYVTHPHHDPNDWSCCDPTAGLRLEFYLAAQLLLLRISYIAVTTLTVFPTVGADQRHMLPLASRERDAIQVVYIGSMSKLLELTPQDLQGPWDMDGPEKAAAESSDRM